MVTSSSLKGGVSVIAEQIANISALPGVYRMLDNAGKVLYVGKAKNLVKRLTNYTTPARLEYRIQSMVSQIASLEVITTRNEAEALLLEANLIKKYEPKYNILLKDDKSYPYILITGDHDFPRIVKHRGVKKQHGKYYGPFPSASAVNKAITDLQKAFLVRPCSDSFFAARKRPCIEYQIKRCSAPCVGKIDEKEYGDLTKQVIAFLEGRSREIQKELVDLMEQASKEMNYEKAATYRDRIKALNHIQAKQTIHIDSIKDADIIGMHREFGQCCIQVFFFRSGLNLGNSPFYPRHTEGASDAEVLSAFILQFYSNNPPPAEIITSIPSVEQNVIEQALSGLAGHKVKISVPKTGDKVKLVLEAVRNANSSLHQKMLGSAKQEALLLEVAKLFDLSASPKRIEVYDNSHIMGKYEIGAMIVAGSDGFNKKAYRRFNIKGDIKGKGDDYSMMEQVLRRRFKHLASEFRCQKEEGKSNFAGSQIYSPSKTNHPTTDTTSLPDLMLIDGGAGHMSVTLRVLTELGLENTIKFACIAKGPDRNAGREWFFMPNKEPFQLPHDAPALYYLQLLRDEAHRFAIGSHRRKRAKSVTKSIIDEIPGIGRTRKKILLNHFGSAESVRAATIEDLLKVEGINHKIAGIIYNYLRG